MRLKISDETIALKKRTRAVVMFNAEHGDPNAKRILELELAIANLSDADVFNNFDVALDMMEELLDRRGRVKFGTG